MAMPEVVAGVKQTAERGPAAVLCGELRGFARLSEALEPALVLQLAGEFFTLAAAVVQSERGRIVGVSNDTLLALFRDGDAAQVAEQAVRAAQRMQRDCSGLAEGWRQAHGLRTAASLALHLGETLFGRTGPAGMEQFVALGDSVSIAGRLLGRARAGELVLSHAVIQVISPESLELDAEPLPPLEIPKRDPIRLYGVLLSDRLDFTS